MKKGKVDRTIQSEAAEGALNAYNRSQMGPIGPTVDIDVLRLISWYGEEAVANALKEATSRARGAKPKNDLAELEPIFQYDARRWLDGGDPVSEKPNTIVAKDFEILNPDPHVEKGSVKKRIQRKLDRGFHGREWNLYYHAANISRVSYPFRRHIEALQKLASFSDDPGAHVWQHRVDWAETLVSDFIAYEGFFPPAELSLAEIESAVVSHHRKRFALNPVKRAERE